MIDFLPTLQSAQDKRDAEQTEYEESLMSNQDNFAHDCLYGRSEQISHVWPQSGSAQICDDLKDFCDPELLFELVQRAARGENVQSHAVALVNRAAGEWALAVTQ